jgi:hypothetical protein
MPIYHGPPDDSHELIQFVRRETDRLRALRKVVISRQKTVVWDVNKDSLEFPGLSYGSPVLEDLLQELGVVFSPQMLQNASSSPSGVKEFDLSARHPWGEDRVM